MLSLDTLKDEIKKQKKELKKATREMRYKDVYEIIIQIETLEFVRDWKEDE